MSAKNKVRGTVLETETAADATFFALETRKAPCSRGSMLGKGYHDKIDVLIDKYTVQCKRFKTFDGAKKILELLPETHNTDIVVFRRDGKPRKPYAVVDLDFLLRLIKLESLSN